MSSMYVHVRERYIKAYICLENHDWREKPTGIAN